jgi:hypothetical protein
VQIGPIYYFRELVTGGGGCQGLGGDAGGGFIASGGGFGCKTFIGDSIGGVK